MACGRLGVKKVILLDKDVVDASNLNRQVLFRPEDVGLPKAKQGKLRLEE
jgi:molybdopterin/thiamine biosynthesis adenylyltransferase